MNARLVDQATYRWSAVPLLAVFLVLAMAAFARAAETSSVLLFGGAGTSPNDVAAVEAILKDNQLTYAKVNSEELNGLSEAQLLAYRLLIIPGGNFIDIGNGLTPNTFPTIRKAIEGGLNYCGICAGAFLAGEGGKYYSSLNLTSGVRFGFYSAEAQGFRKTTVAITGVGTPPIEQYWEDGPQLAGWGTVVGKYPDGTPAVVQGTFGKGWVILCGTHPEAPENWYQGMTLNTPANDAHAYSGKLINAALNRTSLPNY